MAYFGHPQAHEDDVQRSIRAGLGMVKALQNRSMASAERRLTVRLGIHTGPVVVGEIGGGRHEALAVGETLTIAARLKDLAAPGMVASVQPQPGWSKDISSGRKGGAATVRG